MLKPFALLGLVGTLLLSLSACPDSQNTDPQSSASAGSTSATTQAAASNIPEIAGAFANDQISCCWDILSQQAQSQGFDYAATVQKASQGDKSAVNKLLEFSSQLGLDASYGHGAVLDELLVRLGDKTMAETISNLDLTKKHRLFDESLQVTLKNSFEGGFMFHKDLRIQALSFTDFPQTAQALDYKIQ